MATPRSQLIDPEIPLHYHLISRCVRRSFLCGYDKLSRKNYDHRKDWLIQRIEHLAACFAIAVDAYAMMSNHFHIVVYYDPQESYRWSDDEVADRWLRAFPPRTDKSLDQTALIELHKSMLLENPERLRHARATLGSVSMFMKYLKQPIAYRANREDGCSGHFFESRFYSGAILDEAALIAAMAYVDLNPIRARIVNDIEDYQSASGRARVTVNSKARLAAAIEPLISGITAGDLPTISLSVAQYIEILRGCQRGYQHPEDGSKVSRWFTRVASYRKRQRAYGSHDALHNWCTDRGWSMLGDPLPAL